MKKYILISCVIMVTSITHCWHMSERFAAICSSQHMLSIVKFESDPEINEQVGTILAERDYFQNTPIVHQIVAPVNEKPQEPALGFTFEQGQWVWLPVPHTVGRWIWIVRDNSAFVQNMLTSGSLYNS